MTAANPFPGLRPYDLDDSELFFGREDQTHELLTRLRTQRFLAVLGSSGCGKSSLVRAGLLPPLQQGFMAQQPDGWRIAKLTPENNPLKQLALALNAPDVFGTAGPEAPLQGSMLQATLRSSGRGIIDVTRQCDLPADGQLLILVDQFEELLRFVEENVRGNALDEARFFVRLLLEAAHQPEVPIYVVMTMRSEWLGHCAPFPGLPEAINDGLYLVPRMTDDQLRDAICEPIRLYGGQIANRLVNRLLNDLGDEQDQLPVLQHALMRMWDIATLGREAAPDSPIDLHHYTDEKIGGLHKALLNHLEEIWRELTEREQSIAERTFRNLTQVTENGSLVRRRTELSAIRTAARASLPEATAVIDHFRGPGRSFLTPPPREPLADDSIIDLSHESLIRRWDRLRHWTLDEDKSHRVKRMLKDKAAKWAIKGRDTDRESRYFLSGVDLEEALEWRRAHQQDIEQPEYQVAGQFLTRSEQYRTQQQLQEKEAEHAGELRRVNRRLTSALAGAVVLFGMAVGFASWARHQRNEADRFRGDAEEQKRKADVSAGEAKDEARKAQLGQAIAWADKRADESKRTPESLPVSRLLLAVEAMRTTLVGKGASETPAVRPDAEDAVSDALQSFSRGGLSSQALGSHEGAIRTSWSSTDGHWLVTGGDDQTVRVWDLRNKRPMAVRWDHLSAVTALCLSGNAQWLATGSADGALLLYGFDSQNGTMKGPGRSLPRLRGSVTDIEFSRDHRWLVAGSRDNIVRAWRLDDIDRSYELRGHLGTISDIAAFQLKDRDGRQSRQWVATSSFDNTVRLWELVPGVQQAAIVLRDHQDWVNDVAIGGTGDGAGRVDRWLATASDDGHVGIWDLQQLEATLASPSNTEAPAPRAVLLPERRLDRASFRSVTFASNAGLLVAGTSEALLYVWPTKELGATSQMRPQQVLSMAEAGAASGMVDNTVQLLAFSDDERWLASGTADGAIQLRCRRDGLASPRALTLRGHDRGQSNVEFLPAGAGKRCLEFLTTGLDGIVRVWNLAGENSVGTPVREGGRIVEARFSDDDHWLAVSLQNGPLYLHQVPAPDATDGSHASAWRLQPPPESGQGPLWELAPAMPFVSTEQPSRPPGATPLDVRAAFAYGERGRADWLVVTAARSRGTLTSGKGDGQCAAWRLSDLKSGAAPKLLTGHAGPITALAACRKSLRLASASEDRTVRLWNLALDDPAAGAPVLPRQDAPMRSLAWSGDGGWLAAGGEDGRIRLWDVAGLAATSPVRARGARGTGGTDVCPSVLEGHKEEIERLRFSDNGRRLLSVSADGDCRVWELRGPSSTKTIWNSMEEAESAPRGGLAARRYRAPSRVLDISPDGRWLVTGGEGRAIQLWDLDRGASTATTLSGRERPARSLAISPDSRWLVADGNGGAIRVWDLVQAGGTEPSETPGRVRPIAAYCGPALPVRAIAFRGDGPFLVFDDSRITRSWPLQVALPNDRWKPIEERYQTVVGRNLTAQEWEAYFAAAAEPGQAYRKTFGGLDVHYDVFQNAKDLARSGKLDQARAEALRYFAIDAGSQAEAEARATRLICVISGDKLAKTGKVDEAVAEFDAALEARALPAFDSRVRARQLAVLGAIGRARERALDGDLPRAAAELTSVTGPDTAADLAAARKELSDLYATSLSRRAFRLVNEGKTADALRLFQEARGAGSLAPHDSDNAVWQLNELGRQLLRANELDSALSFFREAECFRAASSTRSAPAVDARSLAARTYFEDAQRLARGGSLDEAQALFRRAKTLGDFPMEPELAARQVYAQQLVWNGRRLAGTDRKAATEWFAKAKTLDPAGFRFDPQQFAEQIAVQQQLTAGIRDANKALMSFTQAKKTSPTLGFAPEAIIGRDIAEMSRQISNLSQQGKIGDALKLFKELESAKLLDAVPAYPLNELAWFGCLENRAAEVKTAAELAVERSPEDQALRDTRGMARAFSGDMAGAVQDFQFFVACTDDDERRELRCDWIEQLKAGKSAAQVFTKAVLDSLKNRAGAANPSFGDARGFVPLPTNR